MASAQAYAQWVDIVVQNAFLSGSIQIKNASLDWGKFYEGGDKDNEISTSDVDKIVIQAGDEAHIYACGRESAASGTEGSIDLYTDSTFICTIYWDCPWGSKYNDLQIRNRNKDFPVSVGSWNREDGALGQVDVEIAKKG
ncbi:Asp-hemolysin [Xylaria castorea]|nr:Asp-hemolysin [Xylaria castorea]